MNQKYVALIVVAVCNLFTLDNSAFAQGTAFTYQGQLSASNSPASGNYDFTFALFNNSSTNTGQIGDTLTKLDVSVTNGLFTVTLDFGANFPGANRWLAIGVRTNGGGSFIALNPLQALTPTPYAIYAPNAGAAASASLVAATNIAGTIPLAQLPAVVLTNNAASATLSNLTLNGALTLPAITPAIPNIIYSGSTLLFYADQNDNFYTGPNAGNLTTSGAYNTVIGVEAFQDNSSGEGNTANGFRALQNNTTGANNTAVGVTALGFSGTGDYNTAIGASALPYCSSGNDNTAIGANALWWNMSGSFNTAIGEDALWYNISGSYNTADGASALLNLGIYAAAGGTNNIALGTLAGYNFTGNESSNIDIGNEGFTGENNVIRIGASQTQTYIAGVINGNGGGLANLTAANLTGALPAISGANLTSLNASQLANGTIPLAQLPGAVVTNNNATSVTLAGTFNGNGGGLTNLLAAQLLGGANNNLFIGTLGASTSGAANTAFGEGALNDIFGGGNNTAVGFQALYNTTTGSYNAALGENALYRLGTTGSSFGGTNNLALGYQAGFNYTGNESSNIDIGSLGIVGENNVIRIGASQTQTYISGVINGNAGNLTNLNAGQLSSGVVPTTVLPGFQSGGNYSTVGGGQGNVVSGQWNTISGGNNNTNTDGSGTAATISGGQNNTITNGDQPTIGGGYGNNASGSYATIGGGQGNIASGEWSSIGGGLNNQATDNNCAVPGGANNIAGGLSCFAAGLNAQAINNHSFVWGDGSATTTSTANDQFMLRASGGVVIYSSSGTNAGVSLGAGSGTWAMLSDRNAKNDFAPVTPQQVLAKVAALPIARWSYKTEPGVRHIGPMAQDFYAAFNVGSDDKHITTVDEDGVALAAIQGLNQKMDDRNQSLESRLKQKDEEIQALKAKAARVDSLEKRLNELEETVRSLVAKR